MIRVQIRERIWTKLFIEITGFSLNEIAYIGDDLADLPVISCVGFGVSVPNALEEVQAQAAFVTQRYGGAGAVRKELCEMYKFFGLKKNKI